MKQPDILDKVDNSCLSLDFLVMLHCRPSKGVFKHSSYWLKHFFEKKLGMYISNEDMKCSMCRCGFTPTKSSKKDINQYYKIKVLDDGNV